MEIDILGRLYKIITIVIDNTGFIVTYKDGETIKSVHLNKSEFHTKVIQYYEV